MMETVIKTALTVIIGALAGAFVTYITVIGKLPKRVNALEKWREDMASEKLPDRVEDMERWRKYVQEDTDNSVDERALLLKSLLACLKGLQEKGCNGPVTSAIRDLEAYLLEQSHKPKSYTKERSA